MAEKSRSAGGIWDPDVKLWFIKYGNIVGTELEEHITLDNSILIFSDIPRLKFDKYFAEAVNQGLLTKDMISSVRLTEKGLEYAEEHGLAG